MNRHGASLRSRVAVLAVALAGPAMIAVMPAAPASAATGTAPQLVCPPGVTDTIYCADYCPDATLVGGQCITVEVATTGMAAARRHRVHHHRTR